MNSSQSNWNQRSNPPCWNYYCALLWLCLMADPDSSASEPDVELDVQAEDEDNMGLHPDLTNEQVQSIVDEANAQNEANAQGAPQEASAPVQTTKKRRYRRNMTAEAWKHFSKGTTQDDGSYDATCNYCGEVFPMGNQRGENKVAVWSFDQDTCRKQLATMVIAHEYPFNIKVALPADGSCFHQRCGCHILNLVVQDGLSVVDDEIRKIRDTMKYIRHSQARMERFSLAASQARAPLMKPAWDVPTRWNSTYLMLELALQLRPAIDRYAELDENFKSNPNDLEWEAMEALMDSLKIFYRATLKFSATKYPSLNFFFTEMCEVYINIKKMEISPYPFITLMGKKMFAKWERYWTNGNTLLAMACVLDPRCKITVVEYYYKMMYPANYEWYVSNLKDCINVLFNEYMEAYSKTLHSQSSSSSRPRQRSQAGGASSGASSVDMTNDIRAGLKDYMRQKKTTEPAAKSELEEYLAEPLDDTALEDEFDILTWWKMKVPKYPVLSRLTRDILAVPASTVASESTFSTSGRTLSPVRSCLNDESMEALICAQDWLRARVAENDGDFGVAMWASAKPDLVQAQTRASGASKSYEKNFGISRDGYGLRRGGGA
ncbi:hypothetical protein LUZ61_012288 [Rhynchospora tenuis]|uniref:HAT C-terminal dimerisation domain-containing protein n=1 Tax=Rhynchospora tenuis TaxID=198213 RepID=A0AAD6F1D4_9POAL|nr:hypothetical protein LUZ61_012288 [Rhynchospora tenuis]